MAKGQFKIIGITVSISFIMVIALVLFIKAIGVLFNSWFSNNALWIAIATGIVLIIGLITGSIAIGSMISKGKGIFE